MTSAGIDTESTTTTAALKHNWALLNKLSKSNLYLRLLQLSNLVKLSMVLLYPL